MRPRSNQRSYTRLVLALLAAVLAGFGVATVHSQSEDFTDGRADAEFHFARMIYRDQRGGGRGCFGGGFGGMGRGWWRQDWPDGTPSARGIMRPRDRHGRRRQVDRDGSVFDYCGYTRRKPALGLERRGDRHAARATARRVLHDRRLGLARGVFAEAMGRLFPQYRSSRSPAARMRSCTCSTTSRC
jgi:hypothetical protein